MLPLEERRRFYLEKALKNIQEKVESSSEGDRNNTINEVAFSLGRLLNLIAWSTAEGETWLLSQALNLGLPEREARGAIRSGITNGATKPRDWPPTLTGDAYEARIPAPKITNRNPAEPAPSYPPADRLAAFWNACTPLNDPGAKESTAPAFAWLKSRGLDAAKLAEQDLARAIANRTRDGTKARFGNRSWLPDYRLVVPTWTAQGNMASLQARLTGKGKRKTANPAQYDCKRAVFANDNALAILRGENKGACKVVIVEGLTDFLTWGISSWPVLGVFAGSWTAAHADKIPEGSSVAIRTDNDPAGDKYADKIIKTFKGRNVTLHRAKPRGK